MKFKKVLKETFGDWKHWVGWILSSLGIAGLVYLVFKPNVLFMNLFLIVIVAEVTIDIFKHWIKLQ